MKLKWDAFVFSRSAAPYMLELGLSGKNTLSSLQISIKSFPGLEDGDMYLMQPKILGPPHTTLLRRSRARPHQK